MAINSIRNKISIGFLLGLSLLAFSAYVPNLVMAKDSIGDSANTLKISPVRSDIEVNPGESKTVKVVLTNLTKNAVVVTPIENDFIAKDESGTPSLILNADEYAPTHSLKRFMVPLENVTIPALESKAVEVVINVPSNAQAGGYFGAIRFAPASPVDGGQVNMSASVASLILLTVPGDTIERLSLTDFSVQQNGKVGTFFQNPNNLQFTFRFDNKGNVQQGPFGNISVKKGKKVVFSYDFNSKDPREVVLPDSARRWNVPLENIDTFGHYTIDATLTYGKKNQTVNVTQSFWVVPFVVIVGAIVGIVVLLGVVVGIITFLRSYKKRIINNYGRGGGRRH